MITSNLLKKVSDNEYYWLLLLTTPNLSFKQINKIIKHFGTIENIYQQSEQVLASIIHPLQAKFIYNSSSKKKVEEILKWRDSDETHEVINIFNENFPKELYQLYAPPKIIFIKGNKNLLNNIKISILGTKNPTQDGKLNCIKFARELATNNITIVAGLYGEIDKYIHSTVKGQKSSSIAIIGFGIDKINTHKDAIICNQILENNGLIISEFNPSTPVILNNIISCFRIITSLSKASLIIESLITGNIMSSAELALDMGKEVMAIPGSINNPLSKGCNKLIKNGAKLVDNISDILEEINNENTNIMYNSNLSTENKILSSMSKEPILINELSQKININLNEFYAEILKLELSEKIINIGNGYYKKL